MIARQQPERIGQGQPHCAQNGRRFLVGPQYLQDTLNAYDRCGHLIPLCIRHSYRSPVTRIERAFEIIVRCGRPPCLAKSNISKVRQLSGEHRRW